MNTRCIRLEPRAGWYSFERSKELAEMVWSALKTDKDTNPWRYYSFTSNSSIWDSDDPEKRNYLSIGFEGGSDERIVELTFDQTISEDSYTEDLENLRMKLIDDFGLEEREC